VELPPSLTALAGKAAQAAKSDATQGPAPALLRSLTAEFEALGALSAASYSSLQTHGFNRQTVDAYIAENISSNAARAAQSPVDSALLSAPAELEPMVRAPKTASLNATAPEMAGAVVERSRQRGDLPASPEAKLQATPGPVPADDDQDVQVGLMMVNPLYQVSREPWTTSPKAAPSSEAPLFAANTTSVDCDSSHFFPARLPWCFVRSLPSPSTTLYFSDRERRRSSRSGVQRPDMRSPSTHVRPMAPLRLSCLLVVFSRGLWWRSFHSPFDFSPFRFSFHPPNTFQDNVDDLLASMLSPAARKRLSVRHQSSPPQSHTSTHQSPTSVRREANAGLLAPTEEEAEGEEEPENSWL
jgi:hypothetical protein